MKTWPDPASPWGKRLLFEDAEFELMMDELRDRAGDGVFKPGRGVDVDLVLLRGFDIEADYVELPDRVMGRTLFSADGSAVVQVARSLAEAAKDDPMARWRLRATLGHECGHVACHGMLFVQDLETLSLFGGTKEESVKPKILCRNDAVDNPGYRGEWWEFQANRCMGALLVPTKLTRSVLPGVLDAVGVPSLDVALQTARAEDVVRSLAWAFDVSFSVTFYRLQQLGYLTSTEQPVLRL